MSHDAFFEELSPSASGLGAVPPEPDWTPGALRVLAAVRALRPRRERMQRALDRLERRRLAALLVEAAARTLAARRGEGAARLPIWVERALAAAPRETGWRARARTLLWGCLRDGGDDPALDLVAELTDRARRAWPDASDLVRAAQELCPGPTLAHWRGNALELEGRFDAARRIYLVEVRRRRGARREQRAIESLARVDRAQGRRRTALATAGPDLHPLALADAVADARALGNGAEAERLGAVVRAAIEGARGRRAERLVTALARSIDEDASAEAGDGR